jgi:gluconate 2-dehydrogenase gamma chain
MSDLTRREALGILASIPLAATLELTPAVVERAGLAAEKAVTERVNTGAAFTPTFFTPHEWATVRILVDIIIPRDGRSGSATDAGVPEFMDFILTEYPNQQLGIRGGLAWLDRETRTRFGHSFAESTGAQRTAVLDDIAWPARARPEMSQGVAFFNRFRDMTASGFFSSRVGVQDLQYMGNTAVAEWNGCPPEALRKLGVSY